jgi:transposase
MTQISTTAGIDTSKAKLDAAVHGKPERWQVANDAAGWRQLARAFRTCGVSRVGIEASGGYERGVVAALRKAGFVVLVLQPFRVKAYARTCAAPRTTRWTRCSSPAARRSSILRASRRTSD